MQMTRSMVVEKPGQIAMREFPIPAIGPEDGLIRIEMAGVCGSDPGMYRGKASSLPIAYPLILGHEIVGRVEEIGELAAQRHKVKKGDRVIVETALQFRNYRNYVPRVTSPGSVHGGISASELRSVCRKLLYVFCRWQAGHVRCAGYRSLFSSHCPRSCG